MRLVLSVAFIALTLYPLHGETSSTLQARHVYEGDAASVYDYPSVVLLVGITDPPRGCSGSMINTLWVLTAAHCVDGLSIGPLGNLVVSHGYPLYHETRFAAESVMHPDYDPLDQPGGFAHDLALIRLESKFLSRTAATAAVADSQDSLFPTAGSDGYDCRLGRYERRKHDGCGKDDCRLPGDTGVGGMHRVARNTGTSGRR